MSKSVFPGPGGRRRADPALSQPGGANLSRSTRAGPGRAAASGPGELLTARAMMRPDGPSSSIRRLCRNIIIIMLVY